MKLIVGLGNPGEKYLLTPHNIGWMVMDAFINHLNIQWNFKNKFSSQTALLDQKKILLAKPMTYMNLSGIAVQSIINYYHISLNDLLVIHDDTDLPFLSLRFQKNRGPAGHNGLRSINRELGSQDYNRLRIGMKQEKKNHSETVNSSNKQKGNQNQRQVLKPFTKTEQESLPDFLHKVIEAISCFIKENMEKAANRYNGRAMSPDFSTTQINK